MAAREFGRFEGVTIVNSLNQGIDIVCFGFERFTEDEQKASVYNGEFSPFDVEHTARVTRYYYADGKATLADGTTITGDIVNSQVITLTATEVIGIMELVKESYNREVDDVIDMLFSEAELKAARANV